MNRYTVTALLGQDLIQPQSGIDVRPSAHAKQIKQKKTVLL